MERAYWEFSQDTARYLHEAEKIITLYEFGVYDLLVLPPSFPYGGMYVFGRDELVWGGCLTRLALFNLIGKMRASR